MCDTLGRLTATGAFFAKNSDRSPNEAQLLEFHSRKTNLSGMLEVTYISIPQVSSTHAVLLSRPAWMWGAEMGVNEFGLCIGNEAVFTKGAYGKTGLTGMDLVRLALERCSTAKQALGLILELLEQYGQGGNCGFDHDFFYDNAFLLMDREDLFVLETAGKHWAYKRFEAANISNRLSLGADADVYSDGIRRDFRKTYTEPVFTTFSGSARRSGQMRSCLPAADSLAGCFRALQTHDCNVKNPFCSGSVSSSCMHFGGMVGDHTTSSMVVELGKDTVVWSTGSSVPCISLFKPWCFGTEPTLPVTLPNDPAGGEYWMEAEKFRRKLLGKNLPGEYYAQRDALQESWLQIAATLSREDYPEFSRKCLAEEAEFFALWKDFDFPTVRTSRAFRSRWDKKSNILFGDYI